MLQQEVLVSKYDADAGRLGLSPEQMILGEVLARILSDDANCFTCWTSGEGDQMKQDLLYRLSWEIQIPLLTREITDILVSLREQVSRCNWKLESEFQIAYQCWNEAKARVRLIVDQCPELSQAYRYREANVKHFVMSV